MSRFSQARSPWWLLCGLAVLTLLTPTACADCCPPPQPDLPVLTPCLEGGTGRVAIALGRRANQPDPAIPPAVSALIAQAAYRQETVGVVNVDGQPFLETGSIRFVTDAHNESRWNHDLDAFVRQVVAGLATIKAQRPEADPLSALALASRFAGDGGTVVLLDSGLQTVAPLDFRVAGMLDADPGDVTTFLKNTNQLPDLTGRRVVLSGIGDVLDPQQSLGIGPRERLIEIWRHIVTEAGAECVEVFDEPHPPVAVPDVPTVSLVPVPGPVTIDPNTCEDIVLHDAGSVGFLPNEAVFRDPEEARRTLSDLADRIKRDNLQVELIGTTATFGPEEGRVQLSQARAEAVKAVLVNEMGVDAAAVTARGVGSNWPGRVPDIDENGNLLPGPAALNRSVIVRLSGSVCS